MADLGGSQITALLETVPGIRNVLRSPVADAMVNMIRAAVGLRPFALAEADELVQYAVRRGLISQTEGEQVLVETRQADRARPRHSGSPKAGGARKAKGAGRKPAVRRPVASKKPGFRKAAAKKKPAARGPAKKR
jgi:hypothetical protein